MAFPTTGVLETFTGTNGTTPPNSNWSAVTGFANGLEINGNACRGANGAAVCADYWNASTFGPDSEAYCTITAYPATTESLCRLYLRLAGPAETGYRLFLTYNSGSADLWYIQRLTAGAATTLVGPISQDVALNDKVGIGAVGNILTGYLYTGGAWAAVSGVSYDITSDGTKYTSAGHIALSMQKNTAKSDDFGGGTVVPSAIHSLPASNLTPALKHRLAR